MWKMFTRMLSRLEGTSCKEKLDTLVLSGAPEAERRPDRRHRKGNVKDQRT